MPAATDNGKAAPPGYWKDPATGKPALIGHSNDWFPGDGVTDLIARTPDGKLYVYQSDGNGRFDISRRMEILLPAGAPDPGHAHPARGHPGRQRRRQRGHLRNRRRRILDLHRIQRGQHHRSRADVRHWLDRARHRRRLGRVRRQGPNLLFRDDNAPNRGLALRKGKPGANGGADLSSLTTAGASNGAQDYTYGTSGWDKATWPLVHGTPDVNGDGIPTCT